MIGGGGGSDRGVKVGEVGQNRVGDTQHEADTTYHLLGSHHLRYVQCDNTIEAFIGVPRTYNIYNTYNIYSIKRCIYSFISLRIQTAFPPFPLLPTFLLQVVLWMYSAIIITTAEYLRCLQ